MMSNTTSYRYLTTDVSEMTHFLPEESCADKAAFFLRIANDYLPRDRRPYQHEIDGAGVARGVARELADFGPGAVVGMARHYPHGINKFVVKRTI